MKELGSLFQVPLLQPDTHRQKGILRHPRSPLPSLTPVRQLPLVDNMGRWYLPLSQGVTILHVTDRVGERTSGSEGSTAGQDGRDLSEQHPETNNNE